MTPREVLEQFRIEMGDEAQPPLWTDAEAFRYFVKAQDDMVKVMGGFADHTTSAICTVTATISTPLTAISPYILRVRSGRLVTAERDVAFINEGDLSKLEVFDYGRVYLGLSLSDTDTGDVTHGILGMQENKIRWYKVPAATDTVVLHTFRLPYPRPADWNDTTIELIEDHHMSLVTGMRAQAYLKHDAEAFDRTAAATHKAAFDAYCNSLRKDVERRRYRPRSVQYGGL